MSRMLDALTLRASVSVRSLRLIRGLRAKIPVADPFFAEAFGWPAGHPHGAPVAHARAVFLPLVFSSPAVAYVRYDPSTCVSFWSARLAWRGRSLGLVGSATRLHWRSQCVNGGSLDA